MIPQTGSVLVSLQMADPLTALMYAVQVMNLLKNLTDKTLRERKIATSLVDPSDNSTEPSDGDVEEYNQEEMYTFEEEEENEVDVDHVDKEDEIVKVEEESLLADEHKTSSELEANDQKRHET